MLLASIDCVAIGKYSDEVMYDVVPMHASHLLLGHPWQFDWKAIHDRFRNRFIIVKDGRTITLVPLYPKQVYDDQMKLKRECEDGKSENSREDNDERRPSDLAKTKLLIKPVESGGKTQGVKKVSLCDDNSVEKLKKQPNFYAKGAQIISTFFTIKLMILLVYKRLILTLTILIMLFLVWVFLYCRSLIIYSLKTSLVDYHH